MSKARTSDLTAERKRRYRRNGSAHRRTLSIVRAYQRGDDASAIARQHGISANAVYQTIGRLRRRLETTIRSMDGGEQAITQVAGSECKSLGLNQIIRCCEILKLNHFDLHAACAASGQKGT